MKKIKLGYALCGSFCTVQKSIDELKKLTLLDYDITPIMSPAAYTTDTRFGKAADTVNQIEQICGKSVIHTLPAAEPIGPKNLFDVVAVMPCTGNTLAKLALGITDTAVTMAVKSHLRNKKPIVLGIATNDGLGASAKNIGLLHNTKNIFFVPYSQDDPITKENSLVCDFTKIDETIKHALSGKQLEPVIF